jgi:hypothetical protein
MSSNLKQLLGWIGAICVIILQVVSVLLSNDIETNIAQKAKLMEQKASDIRTLLERTEAEVKAINGDKQ